MSTQKGANTRGWDIWAVDAPCLLVSYGCVSLIARTSPRTSIMRILACFAAALLMAGCAANAHAQAWPTRAPIKLIVPFPPGSALDTIARPVFEQVSKQIGQSFVFESRPGAGGTLGMAQAAKAPADGYTLLVNSSIHTIVPTTFAKLPFDTLREFVAVAPLGQFPHVLVTPGGRFASVQGMGARRHPAGDRRSAL